MLIDIESPLLGIDYESELNQLSKQYEKFLEDVNILEQELNFTSKILDDEKIRKL
jgi:hypothetical protein